MGASAGAAALRRVPPWAWLAAIVAASFVFRLWLGSRMVAPFIFVDELLYSEFARSLAEGEGFKVRGEPYSIASVLYPLLIAPAYALREALPDAYALAKGINAFVMSLAALPAYALARRVLAPGLSLLAALMAVALPSLVYTGTVMTENAYYPALLLVAYALVLVLERPTAGRQLLLLAGLGLALSVRVQAAALVLGVLTAPLLLRVLARRPLREFRSLYAGAGALVVLVVLAQLARGASPGGLLGTYRVVAESGYDGPNAARFLLWHLAELSLYMGVFPLAALLLLLLRPRSLDPPAQALVAATVALSAWTLVVVAVFASRFADRIQERNTFGVVPLFLIALLVWVDRGAPRPRALAVGAALVAGVLPFLVPYERFVGTSAQSDTLMLLPLWNLQDSITLPRVDEAVLAACLAAAAVFLLVPRRWALLLPLAVLGYHLLATYPIAEGKHGLRVASVGALFTGMTKAERDWIDRTVGRDAEVAAVWSGRTDRFTVFQTEFFNRSIRTVYALPEGGLPGNLPEVQVSVDPGTSAVVDSEGGTVREPYAFVDGSLAADGQTLAEDPRLGLFLQRAEGALVSVERIEGMYDDQWSGPEVLYERLRCRGGALVVSVDGDPKLFDSAQTVLAQADGGMELAVRVPPDEPRTIHVPVEPLDGVCRVRFTIEPTAVPGPQDRRELGIHFRYFTYRPAVTTG